MAGDPWAELRAAAAALDLALPASFEAEARAYLDLLRRWERIGRLTGYATAALRIRHLLVESLMLLRCIPEPGTPLLDVGSGAGVPGVVLKLARPEWAVTLLEASRRRANFLRAVARDLGLAGLTVHEGRAESPDAAGLHGRFATVTMRAVPGTATLRRALAGFLHPAGVLVRSVGPGVAAESGSVREIAVPGPGELPWRRRFLIIPRAALEESVSRGTPEPGT